MKLKNRETVIEESSPSYEPKKKSVILPLLMIVVILANFVFMMDQNAKMERMQQQLYNIQMQMNQGMMLPFNIMPQVPEEDPAANPEAENLPETEAMPEAPEEPTKPEETKEGEV